MDKTTLAERNGWLYIKYETSHYMEPKLVTHWWPLKARFADFRHRFTSEEDARAHLGCTMRGLGNGTFSDPKGMVYRLPDGGSTQPEWTDVTAYPVPKQRGKTLPVEYRQGVWYKLTQRGWVFA